MCLLVGGWIEGENTSAALGEFERFAAFDGLFASHLVLVVLGEVADDDWNWKGDDQHSADTARGAHQLSIPTTNVLIPQKVIQHYNHLYSTSSGRFVKQ